MLLALALLLPAPATSSADWLLTPFVGLKFGGSTNLVDLDRASGATKFAVGGSLGWLGDGILGVEADATWLPGFFDSPRGGGLVAHSNVISVTAGPLIAVPAGLMRDSLRPYIAGGVGLLYIGIGDQLDVFQASSGVLGLNLGGGAVGRIGPRTNVRFDVRRIQNLTETGRSLAAFGPSRLSFWRGSIGIGFRY